MTTNSKGQTVATSVATTIVAAVEPESSGAVANTNSTGGASTGALIGGIVGGIVGFLILALLFMSVVLYVLVRRSVERRQAKKFAYNGMDGKGSPGSRSSVAASDTPEEEFEKMEPSFWGVVTRPKQALRVVNM